MICRVACALLLALVALPANADTLNVGSKRFTESYILGEIAARSAREAGADAVHKQGLGNTGIVFQALKSGAIDVYPDYTGTIAREILKLESNPSLDELNAKLAPMGLAAGIPLGFNNTYALAMREDEAAKRGIRTLSDLAKHPDLKLGLSQEFIGRADGWPGLARAYALPHKTPSGLDHGLAYEAIGAGRIDVMDIYSTDAKIERFNLRVLEDDRGYFPKYEALLVYRLDLPARFPQAWAALQRLQGTLDERRMIRLNGAAELQGATFAEAASLYFPADPAARSSANRSFWQTLFGGDFWKLTREHLVLTFASLAASVAVGVPLGVLAARVPRVGQIVLGAVSVVRCSRS